MTQRETAQNLGWHFELGRNILVFILLTIGMSSPAAEKITIGATEVIELLPSHAKVPVRIDTGAMRTSLQAIDLKIKGKRARFKLREEPGEIELNLRIRGWGSYKSTDSDSPDYRPIVRIDFCLGSRRFRIRANLNERSHLKFPMLIGRDVLEDNFIVDVSQSNLLPPMCDGENER